MSDQCERAISWLIYQTSYVVVSFTMFKTMPFLRFQLGNTAYGETGIRDVHLEMANVRLDGRKGILHFIRFPTAEMDKFILLCKMKNLKSVAKTICATGDRISM